MIDYSSAESVLELAFGRIDDGSTHPSFPPPGSLFNCLNAIVRDSGASLLPKLRHSDIPMVASASVEMWHRAIHSFLWSIALTSGSPLWASVSGYYASHYVMRAFAHSMGIFKSFKERKIIQLTLDRGSLVCTTYPPGRAGEHQFYWDIMHNHPHFGLDPLFPRNLEKLTESECAHRNFANYADHLNSFTALNFGSVEEVAQVVEAISRIRKGSVSPPSRDYFPDLQNVQILAFQRIVTFREFLDLRVLGNEYWKLHRDPEWCKDIMSFQLENTAIEELSST